MRVEGVLNEVLRRGLRECRLEAAGLGLLCKYAFYFMKGM